MAFYATPKLTIFTEERKGSKRGIMSHFALLGIRWLRVFLITPIVLPYTASLGTHKTASKRDIGNRRITDFAATVLVLSKLKK